MMSICDERESGHEVMFGCFKPGFIGQKMIRSGHTTGMEPQGE